MKKSILSFTFFICAVMLMAQSYPLGYCSDFIAMGAGEDYTETTYELSSAIQLDADKVASFIGGEIVSIKVGTIGDPEGAPIVTSKDLKVFIRSSLTGENLYVQNVESFTKPGGWTEVVLNEPFPIDGREIFVGYSLTANSIPLGYDGSKSPDKRATWIGIDGKWQAYADCGNASIQAMVKSEKLVHRKVLLEHFTTAQCVNCPPVHTALERVLGNNSNVIWVAHHAGYLEDGYTTNADREYLTFFNTPSAYAPAIMYDRVNLSGYGALDGNQSPAPGPVFFPGNDDFISGLLSVRSVLPSFVTVHIDGTFNAENKKLTATVYGEVTIPELMGANPTMNVFLTENGLVSAQSGGSSKYTHNRVFRDAITGTWGEALEVQPDGTYSKTFEYTLNEKWNPSNMNVIAFLSNHNAKNVNDREVYNAQIAKLEGNFTNINSVDKSSVSIYSNHSSIVIDGNYSAAYIYDATGKLLKVLDSKQNSYSPGNGIYMVKAITGEQTIVKKIAVN